MNKPYLEKSTNYAYAADFIDSIKENLNDEQLNEVADYFDKCAKTAKIDEEFLENSFINELISKTKNYIDQTVDGSILLCELYFDWLYVRHILHKSNIKEDEVAFMSQVFKEDRDAITRCSDIVDAKSRDALYAAAILNLMEGFKKSGRIPEHFIKKYRISKAGYSVIRKIDVLKTPRSLIFKRPLSPNKQKKEFAAFAIIQYEAIMAGGYTLINKTNGFWGRAMSSGKQAAIYNVYEVACGFASSMHLARAKCKMNFIFNPEYMRVFDAAVEKFYKLDLVLTEPSFKISFNETIDDNLQKLLDFSYSGGGGLAAYRLNIEYQNDVNGADIKITDMRTLSQCVHGMLTQANSWNVDSPTSPKNLLYHSMLNKLKST